MPCRSFRGCRWMVKRAEPVNSNPCRNELAREKPESTAGCQVSRVIVCLHRKQACSYRYSGVSGSLLACRSYLKKWLGVLPNCFLNMLVKALGLS
jgi:hypothetical protein